MLTTTMLISFCFKAPAAKKIYWCLGIATLLLIAAIIGSQTPDDLHFRDRPNQKTRLQETKRWPLLQSKVSHHGSTSTTNRSSPWENDGDWDTGLSDTVYGIYIFLDDESLKTGNTEDQWENLNQTISHSCQYVHRLCVRFLIDKKDSQRADIRQFVARYFNTSATLCRRFGTVTEFQTVEVADLRKSTRMLTQLMTSDYVVSSIAYFSVVFVPDTEYRSFPDLAQLLFEERSDGVGLVVDRAQNSKHPSSLFFSKIHCEIFGWFLPPFLADVKLAAMYVSYVYPEELTFAVLSESVNVEGKKDPKSSGFSPDGLEALELDRDTLRRYLSVSRASECFRCLNNTSQKVISMSLYGDNRRYTIGAIRNAQLLPITFPGWRLWIYVELQPPGWPYRYGRVPAPVLAKLTELGAEIRFIDVNGTGLAPMLWRFTVMENPDVDVFVVRDCDSRLTLRDAIVVSDWLTTDKIFHCVRDHPSHTRFPVSGGLWGARRKPFAAIFGDGKLSSVMRRYGSGYVQDMNFLGKDVWPKVTSVAYCHDSFSCQRYAASHPFPVARVGAEHLGQVYDEFSMGRKNDMDTIRRTPVNAKCVVLTENSTRR